MLPLFYCSIGFPHDKKSLTDSLKIVDEVIFFIGVYERIQDS